MRHGNPDARGRFRKVELEDETEGKARQGRVRCVWIKLRQIDMKPLSREKMGEAAARRE
jgi:hypothetical protein